MALPGPAPVPAPLGAPLTTTHRVISYTYDAVGNRLSLTTTVGVVNYQYDAANRLTSVNGQAYTWDANGNLLNDGLRSYSYDHANRLTQVVSGTLTTEFAYDGYLPNHIKRANELLSIGNRVRTEVDGQATDYVMDVASPLPQVLVATTGGQSSYYLHGADLIGQYDSGTWAYHLPDALGSVRSLTDPMGQVVSSYSFSPFGVPTGESGGDPYGFTGEWWESRAELLYLRARMYQPGTGRFITQDPWSGDHRRPLTMNPYLYVLANPINIVDPTGRQLDEGDYETAQQRSAQLLNEYGVLLSGVGGYWYPLAPFSHEGRTWCPGGWKLSEMELVLEGVEDLASIMGGARRFRQHFSMEASYGVQIDREEWQGYRGATLPASGSIVYIYLTNDAFGYGDVEAKWTIVHELAHAWDAKHGGSLSRGLEEYTRGRTTSTGILWWRKTEYTPGCWPVPACVDENFNWEEDFAESVTAFVYPQEAARRALRRSRDYDRPECAYAHWGITSFYETKRAEYIAHLLYLH